ncbi:MAG: thiosulfate oxidation carrier protein SoxY [Magnetococcales bacterium]|nr:thiosulfate oxidation carrier protein SoxY [Magnetococcales bacterium]
MSMNSESTLTRRRFLGGAGALAAACVAAGMFGLPALVLASDGPANVDEIIAKDLGAGPIKMEKVKIDTPPKAENGALVRMPVSVDHPMEKDNYITMINIYVDDNPKPLVGSFEFTELSGKAEVELRIKMAKASQVRAIAKTNKGQLYGAVLKIEVAEGGCAG